MFRRILIATVALVALVATASAVAGTGYKMYVASWHRPPVGSQYSVTIHGHTSQKVLVYVYLDRKPCKASWASESKLNVTPFKAGQSYFKSTGKALLTAWETPGRFDVAYTAHAGSTAEPEYACAYMTVPNTNGGQYRTTVAKRSNAYFVTG